jgi:hypothetical protein
MSVGEARGAGSHGAVDAARRDGSIGDGAQLPIGAATRALATSVNKRSGYATSPRHRPRQKFV